MSENLFDTLAWRMAEYGHPVTLEMHNREDWSARGWFVAWLTLRNTRPDKDKYPTVASLVRGQTMKKFATGAILTLEERLGRFTTREEYEARIAELEAMPEGEDMGLLELALNATNALAPAKFTVGPMETGSAWTAWLRQYAPDDLFGDREPINEYSSWALNGTEGRVPPLEGALSIMLSQVPEKESA